jgi:hypothetical protein
MCSGSSRITALMRAGVKVRPWGTELLVLSQLPLVSVIVNSIIVTVPNKYHKSKYKYLG